MVSSEVEELMLLCDRIAVMSAGRLVEIFDAGSGREERLLAAAFGAIRDPRAGEDTGAMTIDESPAGLGPEPAFRTRLSSRLSGLTDVLAC